MTTSMSCSKTIFKTSDWVVKEEITPIGPGPNYFSSDNVTFLESGEIKLSIEKRNNKWYCAEIFLNRSLGYGLYSFSIDSPLNMLDEQVVLGMFLYHFDTSTNILEEVDIELLRHVDPTKQAAFTIHNKMGGPNHYFQNSFEVVTANPITFSIEWREDFITFLAKTNSGDIIASEKYLDIVNIPSPENMIAHINLYLFQGKEPISGKGADIILKEFSYCK